MDVIQMYIPTCRVEEQINDNIIRLSDVTVDSSTLYKLQTKGFMWSIENDQLIIEKMDQQQTNQSNILPVVIPGIISLACVLITAFPF